MKQDEPFRIKAYYKADLAMLYGPKLSKDAAMKRLRNWLRVNPRLRPLLKVKGQTYTPKQVATIVEELGEP
jgi:hypothetical protein